MNQGFLRERSCLVAWWYSTAPKQSWVCRLLSTMATRISTQWKSLVVVAAIQSSSMALNNNISHLEKVWLFLWKEKSCFFQCQILIYGFKKKKKKKIPILKLITYILLQKVINKYQMRGLGGFGVRLCGHNCQSFLPLFSVFKKDIKKTKHKRELWVATHVSVLLIYSFFYPLSLLFSLPSPPCLPTLRLSCPLVLGTQSIPGAYSSATIKKPSAGVDEGGWDGSCVGVFHCGGCLWSPLYLLTAHHCHYCSDLSLAIR